MVSRSLKPPQRSFFLFGPRQTGKSTWLRSLALGQSWLVSLLSNETYYRYLRDPGQFRREATAQIASGAKWIILDEVQRIPALLDEVHELIEMSDTRFILTGSSARKLKRGGANMLGGRALVRTMHPFTASELGSEFDLEHALQFGTLPAIYGLGTRDAADVLRAYVDAYLREEIQMEGLVRNVGGYTRFLDLAAAYSGETLNASSVARDAGVAVRTVQSYFEVLEDTLISVRLPAWRRSALKRLVAHPKYYLFDTGVTNALTGRLSGVLNATDRGRLFEQLMVLESQRRIDYLGSDARLAYWRTNTGAEVDLLVVIGGTPVLAVEFKARPAVAPPDLSGLRRFAEDYPAVRQLVVCTCPERFQLEGVEVVPWETYLVELEVLVR